MTGADRAGDGAPPAGTAMGGGHSSPHGRPGVGARPAGPARARWPLFIGLAGMILVVDQIVKAWVVGTYQVNTVTPIAGDLVRIALTHNTGALFGMFRDSAILFAIFSIGVIALIVGYEARAGKALVVTLALGLLLGGALGNLVDRLRFGYVVDFVDMGIGAWRWYTFNVADAAISTSVVLLIALALIPGLAGSADDD